MRPLTATPALKRLPFGHFSAFDKENAALRAQILKRDGNTCKECDLQLPMHMEVRHIDDDHKNNTPENLQCVCPFCHLRDHLHTTGFAEAGILVANPQLTQGTLNALTLACWYLLSTVPDKIDIRVLPSPVETDELQRLRKNAEILLRDLGTRSAQWASAYVAAAAQPDVFAETLCALYEHSRPVYEARLESTKYLLMMPLQPAFERQCKDWFAYFSKHRPPSTWSTGLNTLMDRLSVDDSQLMEQVRSHVSAKASKAKLQPSAPPEPPKRAELTPEESDEYAVGSRYD